MSRPDDQTPADHTAMVRGKDGRWHPAAEGTPPSTTVELKGLPGLLTPTPVHPRQVAHDPGAIVRGPDGRWRINDGPADQHRNDEPPSNAAAALGTPPKPSAPSPNLPATTPPVETGPLVRRLAVRTEGQETTRHVLITGDSGHPAAQLAHALQRIGLDGRLVQPLLDRAPGDSPTVHELGLHDGETLGEAPSDIDPPMPGLVIRVVGGPDAGQRIAVDQAPSGAPAADPIRIGRADDADLTLRDTNVSRHHAQVISGQGGVVIQDLDSTNGTRIEDIVVSRALWEEGAVVRVGDSLLQLVRVDPGDRVRLEPADGYRGLNRRFRAGLEEPPDKVRFPRPPNPGEIPKWNLLMAMLPAAGIIGMAVLLGRPQFAFFAVMSPMLTGARTVSSRKNWREKKAKMEQEFTQKTLRAEDRLDQAREAERLYRRIVVPDPARLIDAALLPTRELWSRRGTDEDSLTVKIGAVAADSDISVDAPGEDEDAPTSDRQPYVPIGISLQTFNGLALVGPLDRLRPLACSLVLQTAILHAPSEVQIFFFGGSDAEAAWSWLRWLPHLRRSRTEPALLMGTDSASRAARTEELRRILTTRKELAKDRAAVFGQVLVVIDDASARLVEGIAEILREGGPLGIHALTLDTLQVPEGCDSSVVLGPQADDARVDRQGLAPISGVITDAVPADRCEEVARRLACIQVVGEDEDAGLPTSCRLLSTMKMQASADHIAARWKAHSPSPRAIIGVGTEGPVSIDLTRDGPHALVAGTTRAGKSEFIKTFVASLALENHPDDLSFLFIDFKGGGDYQTLQHLPHAVELVTSLDDPTAFDRTLEMLDAELARRQRLVVAANAATIEGYLAQPSGPPAPMPRLLVVVDEFAELKDRQPQQLDRLVSVARTGGAFGIHLLLATQRPSGVVTGQIDANVGLRVCFRVKDEHESKEIIGAPHAGRIAERHRGRCFLKSAAQPMMEVQTARVAGARPGANSSEPVVAHDLTWARLGKAVPRQTGRGEVPDPDTDLWDVWEGTVAAAAENGWTDKAVPWPAQLPEQVDLTDLTDLTDLADLTELDDLAEGHDDPGFVVLGLADEPSRQRQVPIGFALGAGHVAIAGSARTGRSTALRVALTQLMQRFTPTALHVVGLDFGGGALLPLTPAPHCLSLSMEDLSAATVIVENLEEELARRRELFAANGWPDLHAQHRQSDDPLPWLVLVIDGWDNLSEDGARSGLPQRVATLLARGGPQGLQAIVAGDRGTTQSMIARHLNHRFSLRFNRSVDAELQGLTAKELPLHQPPGRAIHVADKRLLQIAELPDPAGLGQALVFQQIIAQISARVEREGLGRATSGKEPLPQRIEVTELATLGGPDPSMGFPVLVGLGDQPRLPVWLDLERSGSALFVAGPPGSGRSTTVCAIAEDAISRGYRVVAVAPENSHLLRRWAEDRQVEVHDATVTPEQVAPSPGESLLVIVDDLDALGDGIGLSEALGQPKPGRAVIAAGDATWMKSRFSGLAASIRRPQVGVLLNPTSTTNGVEFFGQNLKESAVGSREPGRGVVGIEKDLTALQTPWTQDPETQILEER